MEEFEGFLFDKHNELYQDASLINYFSDINSEDIFREKLEAANGYFSVVIQKNNIIFAAVDYIRSHPLFFSKQYQWIGDNPEGFAKEKRLRQDHTSYQEFRLTGYITGNKTIFPKLSQLQAGEYLVWDQTKGIKTQSYYLYLHKDFVQYDDSTAFSTLETCINNAMERLIHYANGKQLVVPLSGGFDSRLIVLKLKELGYENVLCFSYGRVNNQESLISKDIANYLGYKWLFVDYQPIIKKLYFSEILKNYTQYAHRTVSTPHFQDFFAVYSLKDKEIVQNDAIFVPGHSADFLAGSHLTTLELNNTELSIEEISMQLIKKHFSLHKINKKTQKDFLKRIKQNLPAQPSKGDTSSLLDHWNWRERQSKYIVNSCRIYEFFDYTWHCPLWDKSLIEFFRTLPISYRREKWFYNQYIINLDTKLNNLLKKKYKEKHRFLFIKRLLLKNHHFFRLSQLLKFIITFKKDPHCFNQLFPFKVIIHYLWNGSRTLNGMLLNEFLCSHQIYTKKR